MVYAVSALPSISTKFQVKPDQTGSVAGWVTICAEFQKLGTHVKKTHPVFLSP